MANGSLAERLVFVAGPAGGCFGCNLQNALERNDGEMSTVREPGEATERLTALCFSTCSIDDRHASGALHTSIDRLSGIPMWPFGGARAEVASTRISRHLTFVPASADLVVSALGRLRRSPRCRVCGHRDDVTDAS